MFGLQIFMGHSDMRTTQQYLHSTELRELINDAKETYKGSKLHNIHIFKLKSFPMEKKMVNKGRGNGLPQF
jgi:hypothetical protein